MRIILVLMKSLRKLATDTLVDEVKLAHAAAVNYEKAIYGMCSRIDDGAATTKTYTTIFYDKIGQLKTAKDRAHREKILVDIRGDVEGWDSCVYEENLASYNSSMDRSVLKPKAVKGMYKCKVKDCGSDEFYVWQEQRRSADEGMSTMRQCFKCGKRGKE